MPRKPYDYGLRCVHSGGTFPKRLDPQEARARAHALDWAAKKAVAWNALEVAA